MGGGENQIKNMLSTISTEIASCSYFNTLRLVGRGWGGGLGEEKTRIRLNLAHFQLKFLAGAKLGKSES